MGPRHNPMAGQSGLNCELGQWPDPGKLDHSSFEESAEEETTVDNIEIYQSGKTMQ